MNAASSLGTAALVVLTLAGTLAVSAAPPSPSLIPSHVGASVSFHYDAIESGPRGAGGAHAVLTLTRIVNDRVAVTIGPDEGQASAFVARVVSDGSLRFDQTEPRRTQSANGGGPQAGSDIPLDGPIGGLPGAGAPGQGQVQGQGQGQGRGQYGRAQYGAAPGAVRTEVPAGVRILSALIAARPSASTRSWPFSVVLGVADPGVAMTAKLEKTVGTEATVVADGTGEIRVAAAVTGAAQPAYPQSGGTGGYGRGRRGGQGTPGQGTPGQGAPGQDVPGQGGYGQGGYGQGGYAAVQPPQTVPATATLHVESTFRAGRLQLARGSETTVAHGGGTTGDVTTSTRWTLTAL